MALIRKELHSVITQLLVIAFDNEEYSDYVFQKNSPKMKLIFKY